jgi:hypothetical protein
MWYPANRNSIIIQSQVCWVPWNFYPGPGPSIIGRFWSFQPDLIGPLYFLKFVVPAGAIAALACKTIIQSQVGGYAAPYS